MSGRQLFSNFSPISFNSFPTMASHCQGVLTLALAVVLLAHPSLTCGVTLHVRPTSSNTSCPMHPCHTLSEYAADPGQYFNDSNLTLEFLQGNHTLDVNVTITSIHQLEILGNSSAATRVVCSSDVGFTFRDISEVSIDGLVFVACARSHVVQVVGLKDPFTTYYGVSLQSVHKIKITDCAFQESYGSTFGVVNSNLVLTGNNIFTTVGCVQMNNVIWIPTVLVSLQVGVISVSMTVISGILILLVT